MSIIKFEMIENKLQRTVCNCSLAQLYGVDINKSVMDIL